MEQMTSNEDKLYLLVVGSRSFNRLDILYTELEKIIAKIDKKIVIVSGGARGTDALAKQYAGIKEYEYIEFPADWQKNGKAAGYIRNEEMHKFISQYSNRMCIAFWDGISNGTKHNFTLAEKYHNALKIIKLN